jgi:hypothetical protein
MYRKDSRNWRNTWMQAVFLLSVVFVAAAFPAEPVQLPIFSVQRMDGSASKTSDWSVQGKWLLIYVERRSDPLLRRLSQPEFSQVGVRTTIVLGGMQLQDAQLVQKNFPQLAAASWYTDTPRNAATALNLQGAPMIIGIQDRTLRWRVNGFPRDPKFFQSLLATWATQ